MMDEQSERRALRWRLRCHSLQRLSISGRIVLEIVSGVTGPMTLSMIVLSLPTRNVSGTVDAPVDRGAPSRVDADGGVG